MWKISLKTINQRLFSSAIILLPFNGLPYRSILGEMSVEGAFYPLSVSILIFSTMLLKVVKPIISKHLSAKILALFLLWIAISSMANLTLIVTLQTKGRTGIEKLILQLAVTLFVVFSTIVIFNVVRHIQHPLYFLRRYILISFLIAGLYSTIEIAFLLGNNWAKAVLQIIDSLIRTTGEDPQFYGGRLRSVSGEASWFAMYCSFIFPWIFSYVFTTHRHLWIHLSLSAYLILLLLLTQSRTAYFVTVLQLSLFLLSLFFIKQDFNKKTRLLLFRKNRLLLFTMLTAIAIGSAVVFLGKINLANNFFLIFTSFTSGNDYYTLSNVTRFGSQDAAFSMATDHPFFGVGLGQYGFYMPKYIPMWAAANVQIQSAISTSSPEWPSVYNIYARITAELGWIGLGIWLSMWGVVLTSCYKRYQLNCCMSSSGQRDILGLALIISIVGVLLSGLNTDSLRFFGFWINLAMAWLYVRKPQVLNIKYSS